VITDPLFYAVAIPAVILLGLAKGGFSGIGTLAVPLITLVTSPVQAASITLPILLVQDAVSVWVFRRAWDGRILAFAIPSAAVGIMLGYLLAAHVSPAAVELAVGLTSVAFGARQLWTQWRGVVRPHQSSDLAGVFWSTTSGFTSQIAHAGGLPFQIYLFSKRLDRDVFIGTCALYFAAVNWLKVPAYAALGQFTRANLATSLALFPVAVASTFAGAWLVRRVSGARFYTVMYVLLFVVGTKLAWDGAAALLIDRTW
jgi:uncharacterized membrane protein YfcA